MHRPGDQNRIFNSAFGQSTERSDPGGERKEFNLTADNNTATAGETMQTAHRTALPAQELNPEPVPIIQCRCYSAVLTRCPTLAGFNGASRTFRLHEEFLNLVCIHPGARQKKKKKTIQGIKGYTLCMKSAGVHGF